MRPSIKLFLPLVALAAAGLPGCRAESPDDLDTFVTAQMARREINGLSLAIVQDGRIVVARAYGVTDRGESRKVDTTSLFQAGSISKPVAALGALGLVEQHRLDLDADVNRALKSWQLPRSRFTAGHPVTLREILSHTAGLTVHGFPGYDVDSARPTLVQVLDGAPPANTAPIRNDTSPGALYRYSGGGYTVAQTMVLDATGESFPAYMQHAVLTPLGMGRSSYEQPLPPELVARTVAGYYADRSAVHGRSHIYPEMAAAGLWTTASDLARFAIGVQRAFRGGSGALLSPAMAQQMLTEVQGGYGLGVAVQGNGPTLVFSHSGRDEGFDAFLMATATTGQAVAIMINANDDSRFMSRILDFVRRKYQWPDASGYRAPVAVAIAPERVTAATGLFDGGDGSFITFVERDGHLFRMAGSLVDEEYVAIADDRFASAERDFRVEFARDAEGNVASVAGVRPDGSRRDFPRLGPLFRNLGVGTGTGDALGADASARTDSVLRALSVGGDAIQSVRGVTEGARRNFRGFKWPPVDGMRQVSCLGSVELKGGPVVRHGGIVARVAYCRVTRASDEKLIAVYLTKDDLVTDVDVIDE